VLNNINLDPWATSPILSPQAKFSPEELQKLSQTLDIPISTLQNGLRLGEQWWPDRGQVGPVPPTDPVVYRLYEVCVST
jgi:cyanate lyase